MTPHGPVTGSTTDALRSMITSGELAAGDRVVENRLSACLGVSRAPLREAMRVLEQEGLIERSAEHGAVVVSLGLQDVYEIVTLREQLEEMAVRLGVPVRDPARLERLRASVELMEEHARAQDEASAVEDSHRVHLALVGLAGSARTERAYRALSLQLMMLANRRACAGRESLSQRAARHRRLLELVVAGDGGALLAALHDPSSRSLLASLAHRRGGASVEALEWFEECTASTPTRASLPA